MPTRIAEIKSVGAAIASVCRAWAVGALRLDLKIGFRVVSVRMDDLSYERRLSTRHEVLVDAHYDSSSMDMSGPVANLSRTGLFLEAQYLDDPGSIVAISLTLPSEPRPISIAGRVVRVDMRPGRSGMGIRFTDLSWRSRQRLARFIESGRHDDAISVRLS